MQPAITRPFANWPSQKSLSSYVLKFTFEKMATTSSCNAPASSLWCIRSLHAYKFYLIHMSLKDCLLEFCNCNLLIHR